jgi:RNA polymerase sigma factor (sigma-70 family)
VADVKRNKKRRMEEDLYLISKVKKIGDQDSVMELINRHSGIYIEMVNKYLPDSLEGINKDDVLEDKNFCIYDAAIKFDENKNTKFSTYVGNLARWKCLNIYNKNIKFPQSSISEIYDQSVSCDPELKNIENQEELKNIFKIINNSGDERVKKIFKMRYKDGRKLTPWKKIAKNLGLSIQGCINIHNKHLQEIKRYV